MIYSHQYLLFGRDSHGSSLLCCLIPCSGSSGKEGTGLSWFCPKAKSNEEKKTINKPHKRKQTRPKSF